MLNLVQRFAPIGDQVQFIPKLLELLKPSLGKQQSVSFHTRVFMCIFNLPIKKQKVGDVATDVAINDDVHETCDFNVQLQPSSH